MSKPLEYILKKFPDHSSRIVDLFTSSEDFRMLCEDHLASAEALGEHRQNVIRDREFENEFSQVFVDLEKDIMRLLDIELKHRFDEVWPNQCL